MKRLIYTLSALLLLIAAEPASAKNDSLKIAKMAYKDSVRRAKREAKMRKEMTNEERRLCDSLGKGCVMPKFQGQGLAHFQTWAVSNLRYPSLLGGGRIEGEVVLSFIIERDGSVTLGDVLKATDVTLLQEVVSLIRRVPPWEPGLNEKGEPVRVKYTLPVHFRLHSGTTYEKPEPDPYLRNNRPSTKGRIPTSLHENYAPYGY